MMGDVNFGLLLLNFYRRIFNFLHIFVAASFLTSQVQEKKQLIGPPGSALMIISLVCKTERLIVRNCSLNEDRLSVFRNGGEWPIYVIRY